MRSSSHRNNVSSSPRDFVIRMTTVLLVAAIAVGGAWSGGGQAASAQSGGFTPGCSPSIFHRAHISWTATERYLAAPDAPPDVVASVTDVIEKVYLPDRTMDYTALDALATPEYHQMTGLDCFGVPTPPMRPTPSEASPVAGSSGVSPVAVPAPARLEQVRQTDDGIVSAFLVLPGTRSMPNPDATPGNEVSTPSDSATGVDTPPGYKLTAGVAFVVFAERDGQWMIDYLSGGMVSFSDVVPNDEQLRKLGGTFAVDAAELRDKGMPAFPPDSTLVASPEATPEG